MGMYGGIARSGPNYIVRNGAVAVPADFVGLHCRAWPEFNSTFWASWPQPYPTSLSRAPDIGFGSFRIHDTGYNYWHQLETSAGVYDWSHLDLIVTAHRTASRTVIFCMEGCPAFYVSAGNPAKGQRDQNWVYPDSTSPNGITGLTNFITALVTRYNDPAGAWRVANPTLGKGLQAIEYMNEPLYTSGGYWCNSAGLLIDFAYTIKNAARAVDASIMCVSPGFVAPNTMQTFLLGTGITNTGVTGISLCDAICIHHYNVCPPCQQIASYTNEIISKDAYFRTVVAFCGGAALPIWMTEGGTCENYPVTETTLIAAQTPAWRYRWWGQQMLIGAALGYKNWMCYSWDTPYLNYPNSDPDGTAKAINDIHVNVAAKTIKNAWYYNGGAVTVQFSDNSTFTIDYA